MKAKTPSNKDLSGGEAVRSKGLPVERSGMTNTIRRNEGQHGRAGMTAKRYTSVLSGWVMAVRWDDNRETMQALKDMGLTWLSRQGPMVGSGWSTVLTLATPDGAAMKVAPAEWIVMDEHGKVAVFSDAAFRESFREVTGG